MSPFENVGPTTQEDRRKVWEEFSSDQITLSIMKITPDEMARLHNVFLMSGSVGKQELLNALRLIRRGRR
jgi:hypothetical protein